MTKNNVMILGKDRIYSLDSHETQLNNNVLVVGTSGAGKTRSIVTPNLLQATGSYVISDPKGNLYGKYGDCLRMLGYDVKKLDFTNPADSAHYNPFAYVRSENDIRKLARMLIGDTSLSDEPFWDQASELLLTAYIAYLWEHRPVEEQTLEMVQKLLSNNNSKKEYTDSAVDILFRSIKRSHPDSFAVRQYYKARTAAENTFKSLLIVLASKFGTIDGRDINEMMAYDDVDITGIGRRKTALFVVVSDSDRSMDMLANVFYAQAMNALCEYADEHCEDNALPIPVRFILDDFATNVTIDEFPRMIASFRSRNISCMLMIQAEAQLSACYGADGKTIIGNCDTYVYLGGNDINTAKAVAERCDCPVKKILNMPVGTNWIFRRGQAPLNGENIDLEELLRNKQPEGFAR